MRYNIKQLSQPGMESVPHLMRERPGIFDGK